MIQRIANLKPLQDYQLLVRFDDGKQVIYDVKEDMSLPYKSSFKSLNLSEI